MTMGFYVPTNRDVKFPKACEQCHFYDGLLCCVLDTYVHDPENKHEECPLIEIPDNHGRLIDADAFKKYISVSFDEVAPELEGSYKWLAKQITEDLLKDIDEAPTIIQKAEMV